MRCRTVEVVRVVRAGEEELVMWECEQGKVGRELESTDHVSGGQPELAAHGM